MAIQGAPALFVIMGIMASGKSTIARQTWVVLVMFSGLPGVGKSAIADELSRRIGAVMVSVDPIEDAIVKSGIPASFETGLAAYTVGAAIAKHQLANGFTVIADAANYLRAGRQMWRSASAEAGAQLRVVEIVCSDEAEHRRRLESRSRGLDHYPEPNWAEVIERRNETEPWDEDRLVLDSMIPVKENVERLVRYVDSAGPDPATG